MTSNNGILQQIAKGVSESVATNGRLTTNDSLPLSSESLENTISGSATNPLLRVLNESSASNPVLPPLDQSTESVKSDRSRKSLSQLVWSHISVSGNPDGTNRQTCNYCGKTKTSKQLQTTFWCKHLVDQGKKGCPSCPIEVREMLAAKSGSADVHRAAGQEAPIKKPAASIPTSARQGKRKKQKISQNASRQPTIACICGSQRVGSFNKMLRDAAMERLTEEGAIVVDIDLKLLDLPLYDPDLESENFPASAHNLKNDLIAADGILIASPEYNGLLSPLLLNAITWATRGEGRMYAGFKNKVVSLMSTSPGAMGGMRMLRSLQQMMQDMGAIVVPGNTSIGNSFHVFDRDGRMVDERAFKKISTACYQLVHLAQAHANRDVEDPMEGEVVKLPNMGEYGRADW